MTMLQGKIVPATSAALISFFAWPVAAQQAASAYDPSIAGLCRAYASAVKSMSPESGFDYCMRERGCTPVSGTAQYQCGEPGLQPRHGGGGGVEGG